MAAVQNRHIRALRSYLVGERPKSNGEWDMFCPLHADVNVSVRREYLSGTDFDVGLDHERLVHWSMHDSILAGALVRAPLGHREAKRGNVQWPFSDGTA